MKDTSLEIVHVVAVDDAGGIGKDNKLPWYLPEDLARFKRLTMGYPVLMGRKTFESLRSPLEGRLNIVLTKNRFMTPKNVVTFDTIEKAIQYVKERGFETLFIIGGGTLYTQTLHMVNRVEMTKIKGDFGCDTFYPELPEAIALRQQEHYPEPHRKYKYSFNTYAQRKEEERDVELRD